MNITIISVSSKNPLWVDQIVNAYLKRLPNELNIVLKEIKSEKRYNNCNINQLIINEENKIKSYLTKKSYLISLDEKGSSITSHGLSQILNYWLNNNINPFFIIGGPDGLSMQFKKNSNKIIKLSSLTLPHHIAKIILIEQLYRACSILNNKPYHRY